MILTKRDAMKAVNKKRIEKIIPMEPIKTSDGKGGNKVVWEKRIASMAKFRKLNYKNENIGGAVSSVIVKELEILYRTDIKKDWKLLYNDKTYIVDDVYSYDTETTILVCREVLK